MGEARFLEKIRTIGLAPTKARNILKMATILKERHQGEVPHHREDLEALPGVGRKTAKVVLGEIFKEPVLAVDTHVFRVTQRLGFHNAVNADKCELALMPLIPASELPKAHHLFILHGRRTCLARSPRCDQCVLNSICPSAFKN